jgi:hypothetical protein
MYIRPQVPKEPSCVDPFACLFRHSNSRAETHTLVESRLPRSQRTVTSFVYSRFFVGEARIYRQKVTLFLRLSPPVQHGSRQTCPRIPLSYHDTDPCPYKLTRVRYSWNLKSISPRRKRTRLRLRISLARRLRIEHSDIFILKDRS